MSAPRLRARTFPSIAALSEDARAWLHEQFKAKPRRTNADIGGDLHEKFGEALPRENLRRYRVWWESAERPMVDAYERAQEMVSALKGQPGEDYVELVTQLLTAQALTAAGQLDGTDPGSILELHIFNQKVKNEAEKVALQRERLALQKAAAKVDEVAKDNPKLSREELIKKIREEVYGLVA